ncbi:hypothetical protein CC79DRAFT_1328239 [Sarocladium strictum]
MNLATATLDEVRRRDAKRRLSSDSAASQQSVWPHTPDPWRAEHPFSPAASAVAPPAELLEEPSLQAPVPVDRVPGRPFRSIEIPDPRHAGEHDRARFKGQLYSPGMHSRKKGNFFMQLFGKKK